VVSRAIKHKDSKLALDSCSVSIEKQAANNLPNCPEIWGESCTATPRALLGMLINIYFPNLNST
jgi:hypothetical protein